VSQFGDLARVEELYRPDLQIIELPDPDDLNEYIHQLRRFVQGLEQSFSHLDLCEDFTRYQKRVVTAQSQICKWLHDQVPNK